MREINGEIYLTTGDVAAFINRSPQTIKLYERYSRQAVETGNPRLIPEPALIRNGRRLYTKKQACEIKEYIIRMRPGQLSEFTRSRYKKQEKR